MRRRIDIACGLVVRPEVVFLDEPTTGLDPRSRQAIWDLVTSFKRLGIATLLTTQYLEEADALSDRIIVIDHGEIVAEGTADELKERTGGTYCEIVPQDLNDLPAVVEALGPLLPENNRAAAQASDRTASPCRHRTDRTRWWRRWRAQRRQHRVDGHRPAPAFARRRVPVVDFGQHCPRGILRVRLQGVGLHGSAANGSRLAPDDQLPDIPLPADDDADPPSGRSRSWVSAHARVLALVAVCAIAVTAVSVFVLAKNAAVDNSDSNVPAAVQPPPPAPSASPKKVPAAPTAAAPAPVPTQSPVASPAADARRAPFPNRAPCHASTDRDGGGGLASDCRGHVTRGGHLTASGADRGARGGCLTATGADRSARRGCLEWTGTRRVPHSPPAAPPGPIDQSPPLAPVQEPPPPPPVDPIQNLLSPLLGGLP